MLLGQHNRKQNNFRFPRFITPMDPKENEYQSLPDLYIEDKKKGGNMVP